MIAPFDDGVVDVGGLGRVADAVGLQRRAGPCQRPILLSGPLQALAAGLGEYPSSALPETPAVVAVRCGSRRASVCRSCSILYRFDTYNLIAAGLRGGKDTSDEVITRPRVFLTLTAPSFGRVHLGPNKHGIPRPCHPRAGRGGAACGCWHEAADPLVGTAVDPGSYDYVGQVLFNAHAGALWARFTVETRRQLAAAAGLSRRSAAAQVRVGFAKVAEFQRRGVVHLHAVIRLDGPQPALPPARWADLTALTTAVRLAATTVRISTPDSRIVPARVLAWGGKLRVRPVDAGQRGVPGARVARYVAKYATKAAETAGVDLGPIWCRACTGDGAVHVTGRDGAHRLIVCRPCHGTGRRPDVDLTRLSPHVAALVDTCWRLGAAPEFHGLRRWAHMLGYPGHFTTHSRGYSTTYSRLRAERQDFLTGTGHSASSTGDQPDPAGRWRYRGRGPADVPQAGDPRG